jgi:hypothetical protein
VSDGRRSRCDPAAINGSEPQGIRDAASELLVSLQSRLDALNIESEQTRCIARDLQIVIDEVRQALDDATHG